MKLTGYAVLWNEKAIEINGYTEVFRPYAFSQSIAQSNVYALEEHKQHKIAKQSDGTLTLVEDETGLRYEMTISERDISKYKGVSVQFNPIAHSQQGNVHEVLTAQLIEISLVSNPCYDCTTITIVLDEKALYAPVYSHFEVSKYNGDNLLCDSLPILK